MLPDSTTQSLRSTSYVDGVAIATAPEAILVIDSRLCNGDWTCRNDIKSVRKGGSPNTQANSQHSRGSCETLLFTQLGHCEATLFLKPSEEAEKIY